MSAPVGPYTDLINAMDRYDLPEGRKSPRAKAIRALDQRNNLPRFSGESAQRIVGPSHHVNVFGFRNTVNTGHQIHIRTGGSGKKKEDKEGKEQASGWAIAGIAILVLGGMAAAGYSANKLWETSSARKEIDAVRDDAQKLTPYAYLQEAEECRTKLVNELEDAHEGLTKEMRRYQLTTFASAALMLGISALAYNKLYRRSHTAYTVMVASLLTSAGSFGLALGFCGLSKEDRKEILNTLEKSYQERRAYISDAGETRYAAVKKFNLPAPPPASPPPVSFSDYDAYTSLPESYRAFDPFPAPSAPPVDA